MKFLLDANVISEVRKRRRAHPAVVRWVESVPSNEICMSVLVIAEIRHGIELLRRRDAAQAVDLDHWFDRMRVALEDRVLPVSEDVALAWARMGVPDPVPPIDALLAATAIVHGATLVTRNVRHVERTGARIVNPFEA